MFAVDTVGRVSSWGLCAARITGYDPAEIVGQPLSILYDLKSVPTGQAASDLADVRRVGFLESEGWRVRKDGQVIRADTVLTAMRDHDGSLTGFVCILRDLTAVEAAEARKRVRAERLAMLSGTQQDLDTLGFDIAALLPRVASRVRGLTGADAVVLELREGSGDRARAHVGDEPLDVVLSEILAPQGGSTSGAKLRCLRYDGANRSSEILAEACNRRGIRSVMAIPLLHDRATIGWIAVLARSARAFDDDKASTLELLATLLGGPLTQAQAHETKRALVAERSRAQVAQREGEARFHAAMDASLDALFIAGAVRDGSGAIVDFTLQGANRRALELCATEASALVGHCLTSLPAVAQQLGSIAKLAAVVESRTPVEQERQSIDGTRRWWIEEQIVPLEDGVTVTLRDVTARVEADAEVRRAREVAEAASRAKSEFVARMSHELRTPLNSVIGFANVLRRNKRGALDGTELGYLQRVLAAATHLLALINSVLDISKVEAGRMTLEREVVDLGALTRSVLSLLDTQAQSDEVTLVVDVPEARVMAWTDGGKLRQVLLNVVGNALKFTPAGRVTVRLVAEPDSAGGDAIARYIEVRDTGIGIPADRLHAVFDAFEQGESFTSRRYGGTGLGLAISRALCEAMGFALEVESVLGEGTSFRINLLPTATSPVVAAA